MTTEAAPYFARLPSKKECPAYYARIRARICLADIQTSAATGA
jgi:hypothetical protein